MSGSSPSQSSKRTHQLGQRFYFLLGYAINHWSNIDRTLFSLFRLALGAKSDKNASIVFYKFNSLSDHLQITDLLLRANLTTPLLDEWQAIHKKTCTLINYRNRIAHDPASQVVSATGSSARSRSQYPANEANEQGMLPFWQLNVEGAKLLKQSHSQKPSPILAEGLTRHIEEVLELEKSMAAFADMLPQETPGQPKQRQVQPKTPHMKKRVQTRSKPRTPPRSSPG